jgi:hypothetical protein
METIELKDMIGKVFVSISAATVGDDTLTFFTKEGDRYTFYHEQDCCEHVSIKDISGDFDDLLNFPIVEAEEVTNKSNTDYDSETWTFYKFGTRKGHVTVQWLGTSNGYYSEYVSFKIEKATVVNLLT